VAYTNRGHLENFPVNEFDAFFGSEESGFRHFENVVGRE
jgi:hypothetical protein